MRTDDPRAGRVEQVGQMSRGLKILARELEVPVIGISQLSRAPEQRPDKVPILSDLSESGCLAGDTRVLPARRWRVGDDARSSPSSRILPSPRSRLERGEDEARAATRLTNAFCTGMKPIFRLTTKLGRTIRATGNHKFRTFDGWRRLDELELGRSLALPRELSGPVESRR